MESIYGVFGGGAQRAEGAGLVGRVFPPPARCNFRCYPVSCLQHCTDTACALAVGKWGQVPKDVVAQVRRHLPELSKWDPDLQTTKRLIIFVPCSAKPEHRSCFICRTHYFICFAAERLDCLMFILNFISSGDRKAEYCAGTMCRSALPDYASFRGGVP
jgi:hypothetical protein